MEQVLYRLHVRLLTVTNRVLPHPVRRTVEFSVLAAAIACTISLGILHITYVLNSSSSNLNCILTAMESYKAPFPLQGNVTARDLVTLYKQRYDLISLQIDKSPIANTMEYIPTNTCTSDGQQCANLPYGMAIAEFESSAKNFSKRPLHEYLFSFQRGNLMLTQEPDSNNVFRTLEIQVSPQSECFGPPASKWLAKQTYGLYDVIVMNWAISAFSGAGYLYNLKSKELFNLNYAADFNNKKGVNMASMGRRESYKHDNYFGEMLNNSKNTVVAPFIMVIRDRLWALADFVLSSIPEETFNKLGLQSLRHDGEQEGADATSVQKKLLQVNQYVAFRVGVVFSTTFIFFISSTLVSYVLRETQERMLRFTFLLQYHITNNLPYLPLIFTHVVGSLVFVPIIMGIYFFMFEFFSDQLLAFLVLLIVWMGEVFSVLSLRSKASIRYFPSMFCCYFYMFHVYFFNYPFGFCYLALLTSVLFVLHSMTHFWNVYEVPTFQMGLLSAAQPRLGIMTSTVGQQPQPQAISPRNSQPLSSSTGSGRTPTRHVVRPTPDDIDLPAGNTRGSRFSSATTTSDRSPAVADYTASSEGNRPRSNSANSHRPVVNLYESVDARRVRLQAAKEDHNNPNTRSPAAAARASSNPNTPQQSSSSDKLFTGNKPSMFPSLPPTLNNPEGGRRPRSSSEGYAPAWSVPQMERQKSSDSNDDYGFFDDGDVTPKSPGLSGKFARDVSYNTFGYDGSSKFTIFGNYEDEN